MTTRRWITITVILGVLLFVIIPLGLVAYVFSGGDVTMRISQPELQAAIEKKFPLEKKYLLIFTIRYANPVVKLEDGSDRVQVGLDATTVFSFNDKTYGGTALVSGALHYDSTTGEFLLADARVEQLAISGLPEKYRDDVAKAGSVLLREYFERKSVYRLKTTDLKQAAAKLVLKTVTVKDQHLEVIMGITQ